MANISKEELEKRIDSLPEEIQNLLYSPEMYTAIKQVSAKHQLHVDQMDLLETETSQVMLGITQTAQFPKTIAQSLKVDAAQAEAIAKDIDEVLFSQVRSAMKKADEHTAVMATPSVPPAIINPPTTAGEKSVVMPSAAKAPVPTVTAPAPATVPAATPVPPVVKPVATDAMQHVEAMLSAPTVSIAPKPAAPVIPVPTPPAPDVKKSDAPTPPPIYKTDPYHEPVD